MRVCVCPCVCVIVILTHLALFHCLSCWQFVILAALVAAVSAGGPAAYSIAAPSADFHSVGASHEHTVKGLYGQNVLSQYSKAVDSAHSSVRVHSSRLSNDGYAYAAPAVKYAAPAYGKQRWTGDVSFHFFVSPLVA